MPEALFPALPERLSGSVLRIQLGRTQFGPGGRWIPLVLSSRPVARITAADHAPQAVTGPEIADNPRRKPLEGPAEPVMMHIETVTEAERTVQTGNVHGNVFA